MSSRSRRGVIHIAMISAAVATFTSGCSSFHREAVTDDDGRVMFTQCVDQNDNIVPDDYCEHGHGGGGYYIISHYNGYAYPMGTHVSSSVYINRVPYNNPSARTSAGYPASGRATGSRSVSSAGIGGGSTGGKSGGTSSGS